MSLVITYHRFWQRRDTAANWESINPVLHSGEFGVEIIEDSSGPTGELKLKLGNGTDAWNVLGYFVPATTDDLPEGLTNLYYTTDRVEHVVGNLLVPGSGIDLDYSPSNGTLTITATGGGGSSSWTTVKKTSDEVRNSGGTGSTLTDDSQLSFTCSGGVRYEVRILFKYNQANAAMDFKYNVAFTAAFSGESAIRKTMPPTASPSTAGETQAVGTGVINHPGLPLTTATTGIGYVDLAITFVATESGTFSFKWAQNTADAGDLTGLAGSYLEWMTS